MIVLNVLRKVTQIRTRSEIETRIIIFHRHPRFPDQLVTLQGTNKPHKTWNPRRTIKKSRMEIIRMVIIRVLIMVITRKDRLLGAGEEAAEEGDHFVVIPHPTTTVTYCHLQGLLQRRGGETCISRRLTTNRFKITQILMPHLPKHTPTTVMFRLPLSNHTQPNLIFLIRKMKVPTPRGRRNRILMNNMPLIPLRNHRINILGSRVFKAFGIKLFSWYPCTA